MGNSFGNRLVNKHHEQTILPPPVNNPYFAIKPTCKELDIQTSTLEEPNNDFETLTTIVEEMIDIEQNEDAITHILAPPLGDGVSHSNLEWGHAHNDVDYMNINQKPIPILLPKPPMPPTSIPVSAEIVQEPPSMLRELEAI